MYARTSSSRRDFAPQSYGGEELSSLLLTLVQLPLGMTGLRFYGGSFMSKVFFVNDLSGKKKEALEEATMGFVDIRRVIAREALPYVGAPASPIQRPAAPLAGNWWLPRP